MYNLNFFFALLDRWSIDWLLIDSGSDLESLLQSIWIPNIMLQMCINVTYVFRYTHITTSAVLCVNVTPDNCPAYIFLCLVLHLCVHVHVQTGLCLFKATFSFKLTSPPMTFCPVTHFVSVQSCLLQQPHVEICNWYFHT